MMHKLAFVTYLVASLLKKQKNDQNYGLCTLKEIVIRLPVLTVCTFRTFLLFPNSRAT